jgi:hypothetical protein
MNTLPRLKYPPVQVKTPMPADAPRTLTHRGQIAVLPAKFDRARAIYLLSLCSHDGAATL